MQAQNLSLTDMSNQADITGASITIRSTDNNGWVGFESLDLAVKVSNTSAGTMEIGARKIELDTLQSDVQHTICFAGACYATTVFVSPNHLMLPPGASDSGFIAHYLFDNRVHIRGINHVEYMFYNVNNPVEAVTVNVTYNTVVNTGIDEQNNTNSGILLFPNPANELITLAFDDASSGVSDLQLKITGAMGDLVNVMKQFTNEKTIALETKNLPAGIYFLSVQNNGKTIKSGKFAVTH